jgi:hypothetical protein
VFADNMMDTPIKLSHKLNKCFSLRVYTKSINSSLFVDPGVVLVSKLSYISHFYFKVKTMTNKKHKEIDKEVLLSTHDVQQFFKISKPTLQLFNHSLKPVRVENKKFYTISSILNLLSELINKVAKK